MLIADNDGDWWFYQIYRPVIWTDEKATGLIWELVNLNPVDFSFGATF